MKLTDATVFVFDTETTGTSVREDRIVELGAAYFENGSFTNRHLMRINPGMPIPAGATKIHGIRDADVRDSPSFGDVADRFVDHMTGKHRDVATMVLAGYNATVFDAPLVNEELARSERPFRIDPDDVLDVLVFVRWHHRHNRKRTLVDMCRYYDVELRNAHSASADAISTGRLLFKMVDAGLIPDTVEAAFEEQRRLLPTLEDEWERWSYWLFRHRETEQLTMGAGKHCGQPLDEVDPDYLRYLLQTISDLPDGVRLEFKRLTK